jgi:AraC-like DNA-binding protein
MDEICVWLEKTLAWVDRCGPPAIPYAGHASGGYSNPPAPHLEIACLLDGAFEGLKIGNRQVEFPAGHLAVHNVHLGNFTPRTCRVDSWCVFLDVSGEPDFACLQESPLFCLAPLFHRDQVVGAFERFSTRCVRHKTGPGRYPHGEPLYDASRSRKPGATAGVFVKAALLELLAVLLDETRNEVGTSSFLKPTAVQTAVERMGLQYRNPALTLAEIASAACLSIDHFGRLFREHMGETPMRHLKRVRVAQSRYLLEHTTLRIEEVGREVGFEDPFHFSRVFSEIMGVSPQVYRRQTGGKTRTPEIH